MSPGRPGSVSPASRFGCDGLVGSIHSSDARYQVLGTRTDRCMSLATSGRPAAVSAPDTTQLLLPTALSPPSTPNSQFRLPKPGALFAGRKRSALRRTLRTSECDSSTLVI